MPDRTGIIADFLRTTVWADWTREPMAGDASARRYERLCKDEQSVILMDAPPENGEDTRPFSNIAAFLGSAGLCPPDVLAHDPEAGIMVLSDLGRDNYSNWLSHRPTDETRLYRAAVNVLVHLHEQTSPDIPLIRMTPDVAADMIGLTGIHYSGADVSDLKAVIADCFRTHAPLSDTLSLRDYHAENLIWRPALSGLDRVGLLDFQDAFLAPAGYDLASLLRDVRRDVDIGLAKQMTNYYIQATGADKSFDVQLACLGAQRNLRILGVFARLAKVRGKPHYIDLIPRVWFNLMRDLNHPALARMRQATLDVLPVPDATVLDKLRA